MVLMTHPIPTSVVVPSTKLADIEQLDRETANHFKSRLVVEASLTRSLVSFQANKSRAAYRWYKYKEAFSASLMEYILHKYQIASGAVLDPFAGSGTTLFAVSAKGMDADGVELLSIGQQIVATRICLERDFQPEDFRHYDDGRRTAHGNAITVDIH